MSEIVKLEPNTIKSRFHCRYCQGEFTRQWYKNIHERKCQPWKLKLRNDGVLIQIHHDKMNLARALVTAKARVDQDPLWHHMRVDFKMQRDRAIKLHEAAQISYRRRCCYLDLYKFQDYLKDYQIIVVHMDQLEWENLNPEGTYQLMLLCDGEHYDVITSLPEVITVMKAEEKQKFKKKPFFIYNIVSCLAIQIL